MVVEGKVSYSNAQQLSVVISKVWARARIDDKVRFLFGENHEILLIISGISYFIIEMPNQGGFNYNITLK